MKHIITKVFILLLLAVAGTAKAQNVYFAPIGAEWYYETQSMFTVDYIKMMAEKLCLFLDGISNCDISVFDYAGRTVLRCSVNGKEAELDLGELPAGLYCVTANDGNKVSTTIIVKQ